MSTPLWCLLAFAAWTWAIPLSCLATWRIGTVLQGKNRPNAFSADTPHGPDWYRRANRAHLNCVENIGIFGAVVLIGAVTGLAEATFDTLAVATLLGRVGQTTAHIASGRSLVVQVRFVFFLVQVVSVIWMGLILAQAGLAS